MKKADRLLGMGLSAIKDWSIALGQKTKTILKWLLKSFHIVDSLSSAVFNVSCGFCSHINI